MADERRDSLDQLTDAARAASKVAKIVQAAQAGGAAGAAAQTIKEYHKQAVTVIVVVLLLPVLLILSLPAVVFGSLMAPSDTVLTDEMEIAENVIEIKNSIGTVLQTAYEDVLAEIEDDSKGRYAIDVVDPVGGQVSFNALEILSMYCAHMGATEYEAISIDDLTEQVKAHQDEYYSYTAKTETNNYFADTIWQLDETERAFASDYAQNLTLYLQEIEEREGISILEQINDLTAGSTVPVAEGDFGNPFNDPNWRTHITSRFGKRPDVGLPGKDTTNHNGLDIAYGYGTPILAVQSGTVITATTSPSYGNYVVIDHGGGICTLYAHCSRLLVRVGQTVSKYDTIAEVGSTGDSTGNHLHICFIVNGQYTDPEQYLH